jgi:hypothetical protein
MKANNSSIAPIEDSVEPSQYTSTQREYDELRDALLYDDPDTIPLSRGLRGFDRDDQQAWVEVQSFCPISKADWDKLKEHERIPYLHGAIQKKQALVRPALPDTEVTPVVEQPQPAIGIDHKAWIIRFDGKEYECNSEQALLLLQFYIERPNECVTASEIKHAVPMLQNTDLHKLRKKWPAEIQKLVKSRGTAGCIFEFPPSPR